MSFPVVSDSTEATSHAVSAVMLMTGAQACTMLGARGPGNHHLCRVQRTCCRPQVGKTPLAARCIHLVRLLRGGAGRVAVQGQRAMGRVSGQVEGGPDPILPQTGMLLLLLLLRRRPACHVRPIWLPCYWLRLMGTVLVGSAEEVQQVLISGCLRLQLVPPLRLSLICALQEEHEVPEKGLTPVLASYTRHACRLVGTLPGAEALEGTLYA